MDQEDGGAWALRRTNPFVMTTQIHQEGPQFIKPCHPEHESSGLCKMSTLGLLGPEGISLCSINSHRFFSSEDVTLSFEPVNFQYPPALMVGLSTAHPASSEDLLRPEPPSHCLFSCLPSFSTETDDE